MSTFTFNGVFRSTQKRRKIFSLNHYKKIRHPPQSLKTHFSEMFQNIINVIGKTQPSYCITIEKSFTIYSFFIFTQHSMIILHDLYMSI